MTMHKEVAIVAFYDHTGRILLQERKDISKFGEEWGFFGGGVKPGETKDEALKREIKEELDYKLQEYEHLYSEDMQVTQTHRTLIHMFIAPLPPLEQLTLQEGSDLQLFSLSDAKNLKFTMSDFEALTYIEKRLQEKGILQRNH